MVSPTWNKLVDESQDLLELTSMLISKIIVDINADFQLVHESKEVLLDIVLTSLLLHWNAYPTTQLKATLQFWLQQRETTQIDNLYIAAGW